VRYSLLLPLNLHWQLQPPAAPHRTSPPHPLALARTLAPGSKRERSSAVRSNPHPPTQGVPINIIVVSSSATSSCMHRTTPASPWLAIAYSTGLPTPTAFAPNANALYTSAPCLTPPSMYTSIAPGPARNPCCSSASITMASALKVGRHPSRFRPKRGAE
jgi:hypothetical protein